MLRPETTGTEQVFDNGQRTYVRFKSRTPAGVMFFQQDGQSVRATVLDHFAIINGVHAGLSLARADIGPGAMSRS